MIGCIAIGGVILVPALVFLAGIPIQIAIPAAMFAYILSGLVATAVFARNKSIDWRMASSLCIGGTPAAFAGAWAVSIFDGRLLAACLGVLTLLSGVNSLRPRLRAETDRATVSHGTLSFVGAATGFLSSLTGTGGPLLLVPILLSMWLGVLASVGLSQIFQLPVAICCDRREYSLRQARLGLGHRPRGKSERRLLVRRQARSRRAAGYVARHHLGAP